MKTRIYTLLTVVFLFLSCGNSKNTNPDKRSADFISTPQQAESTDISVNDIPVIDSTNFEHYVKTNKIDSTSGKDVPTIDSDFTEMDKVDRFTWENLPIKDFPITDNTNFNWYYLIERDEIDEKEIKTLNLKSLSEGTETEDVSFHYNYRIHFSDDFYSIVISIGFEMALATYLVNFDKNDKIIDKIEIAFDETAESIYRKTSDIYQNKIVVEAVSIYDEPIFIKTENYIIEKDGTFKETMTAVIDFEKLAKEKHKK